jgi:hypothetical protein
MNETTGDPDYPRLISVILADDLDLQLGLMKIHNTRCTIAKEIIMHETRNTMHDCERKIPSEIVHLALYIGNPCSLEWNIIEHFFSRS